ncbi:MAG: dTDP-4-dehydrorhamnose reductase, partial [Rhodospirillales bacterium]|nr:dTDP-4-dehydrorhamnose reductase [Rhodospirillales bacterium]
MPPPSRRHDLSRIVLTGAGGQIGRELMVAATSAGLDIRGFDRAALDITDAKAVKAAIAGADILINAAAYTAVDDAESNPDQAHAVNAIAPGILAKACADQRIPLIHISTDYVFDGTKTTPWREDDPIHPINVYGASKAGGEMAVRNALHAHIILRTSWIYASHGRNFVRTMVRIGKERPTLNVVDDQVGTPTAAKDIAAAILVIARRLSNSDKDLYGTYHYTAAGKTTWCAFAETIFQYAEQGWGRRPRVLPIATRDYPTPASRPANSVL